MLKSILIIKLNMNFKIYFSIFNVKIHIDTFEKYSETLEIGNTFHI